MLHDLNKIITGLRTAHYNRCFDDGGNCAGNQCPYFLQDCNDMLLDAAVALEGFSKRPSSDRVQCCINHINSSLDVDPWAAQMAERALRAWQEPKLPTDEQRGAEPWPD